MTPPRDAIPAEVALSIRRMCVEAVEEIVGHGYVPDYYASYATGFIGVAEWAYLAGVKAGRERSGL